jgi:hypothetical protein
VTCTAATCASVTMANSNMSGARNRAQPGKHAR